MHMSAKERAPSSSPAASSRRKLSAGSGFSYTSSSSAVTDSRHRSGASEDHAGGAFPSAAKPHANDDSDSEQKLRRLRPRSFLPRASILDSAELKIFRGFIALFWTGIGFYALSTVEKNYLRSGALINVETLELLYSHFVQFAIKDAAMVASLFLAPLYNWCLLSLRVRHSSPLGAILQHSLQTVFFFYWIFVAWAASWSWIQSGIFTLHLVAMLFKMHSYNVVNGVLRDSHFASQTSKAGAHDEDNDELVRERIQLRARLSTTMAATPDVTAIKYPHNLSLSNFTDFLLCPTIVYELEYPRSERFRPLYFTKITLKTFATVFLLYLTIEHYIIPTLYTLKRQSLPHALQELLFPVMICYLLLFYIMFECVCVGFAEIARFADRHFYDDWWNSTTFEQFARKWNRPVHEFLFRHVYLESIHQHNLSKSGAIWITFLFSSAVHELVMVMVARRVRLYLFAGQMCQLPLIMLASLPIFKSNPVVANVFFWVLMFSGPPILAVAYCWEVYA